MSKTADLEQAIWGDPWFLSLTADAKVIYLWAISTAHGNLGGLFVVARPLIEAETNVKGKRFDRALEQLAGKLLYHEETGAVWVRGRAKRVRSKTTQIAKSIAGAVLKCPYEPFAEAFIDKYASDPWLTEALTKARGSLNENRSSEPNAVNLTRGSSEAPSTGTGPRYVVQGGAS